MATELTPAERGAFGVLAAGRIAIGTGIWFAPAKTFALLGFGELRPEALALARLAGGRDVILGAWMGVAGARDRDGLRAATNAAIACDGGDAVAFAALAASGNGHASTGLTGMAAALPAAMLGFWLRNRL